MAVGECLKISIAGLCRDGECSPTIQDAYTAPEGTASPAADVWSLGVTLVETLTQHPPVREPAVPADPVVPDSLPQPFLDIARQCLRSDPKARSTIADLAARLRPAQHPEKRLAKRPALKWTYALGAAAGLVLAAFVIAPRVLDRQAPVAPVEPPQIHEAPPVQPAPPASAAPPAPAPVGNEIVQRVMPQVPSQAARTIQGRVKVSVRVRVDPSGSVAEAKVDSGGPSKYFTVLALQAARRWKFAPADAGDSTRPREWMLHFEFSRTGTRAVPVRRSS